MILLQDAFSENAQHLQKVLIAYLNRRGKSDPACAVSGCGSGFRVSVHVIAASMCILECSSVNCGKFVLKYV